MTAEHKAAMEQGRIEGRVVRDYLEALRSSKPKRGRKRTQESITKRLTAIDAEIAGASAIEELKLVQERRDLTAELESMNSATGLDDLQREFIKVAGRYSSRKGITYGSWRDVGVPASVLKQAGLTRGR